MVVVVVVVVVIIVSVVVVVIIVSVVVVVIIIVAVVVVFTIIFVVVAVVVLIIVTVALVVVIIVTVALVVVVVVDVDKKKGSKKEWWVRTLKDYLWSSSSVETVLAVNATPHERNQLLHKCKTFLSDANALITAATAAATTAMQYDEFNSFANDSYATTATATATDADADADADVRVDFSGLCSSGSDFLGVRDIFDVKKLKKATKAFAKWAKEKEKLYVPLLTGKTFL